jgi:hypothetical protein
MSFFIIIFFKSWWERKSATKKEGEATKEKVLRQVNAKVLFQGRKKDMAA